LLISAIHAVATHVTKKEKEWMADILETLFSVLATHIKTKPIVLDSLKLLGLIANLQEKKKFAKPAYMEVVLNVLKTYEDAPAVLAKVIDFLHLASLDKECKDLLKKYLLDTLQTMQTAGKFKDTTGAKPQPLIESLK